MPFTTIRTAGRMLAAGGCIFLLGIAGCKKDDEANANAFTFDGNTHGLRSAMLFYAQSPESADDGTLYYQNIFMLLSVGLATDGHSMTGRGDAVELSVYCVSQDLDAGTYSFTAQKSPAAAFGVQSGTMQLEVAEASAQPVRVLAFSAGQMIVTRSGRNYTIKLAGTIDGKVLKAQFTGVVSSLPKD